MKIKLLLIILLYFGFTPFVNCQEENPEIRSLWANPDDLDFNKLQITMEDYYADKDKGRGSGYKQWKRFEESVKNKLDNEGKLTNTAARNYKAYTEYFNRKSSMSHTGDWNFLTPSTWTNGNSGYNPGIGRVNCIAFHPSDEDIIFIGTPNGGIWKTDDRGISWTPMHDGMPSLGVSGIVIHPTQPDTMYIITGDGDGGNSQSIGVLKTYDAGVTWLETGLKWDIDDFEKGYKIVLNPTSYSTMLVATTDGIWKTDDGGANWYQKATGTFRDIEYHPGNPNIMYAEKSAGFYRSIDRGESWTQINSGTPVGGNRLAIAVTPNHPDYVYLLCGPSTASGVFKGFFRSTDAGLNFDTQTTTPNILGYSSSGSDNSSQNWYDIALAAHPTINDKVYSGGINVWRTTDAINFTNISQWVYGGSQYTHADIHALEYNPLNNYLYCGSDGGIFESIDGGDSWTNISDGLAAMQFYKIAGTELDDQLLIGGTQDNGSNKWSGGTDITHIFGADGMDCMIDYNNNNTIYFSFQNGGLRKSNNGGNTSFNIKPSGAVGSWVTPYMMDPGNPNIIYSGYSDVFRSTDGGANWTNKGADGRSAMAMGTNNTSRLYAARNNTLRMSSNSGDSWTNITGPWSGQNVTGIAVNPDNDQDVFVTVSGYVDESKVYYSMDAGGNWTNISGTLPNIPHNCIAFEDTDESPNDALYVGTDIGVFYRNDDLGDWIPFSNGMPTVEVKDLEINYGANVIRAATFGRSIWSSALYSPCPVSHNLTVANNPGQTGISTGYQYYQASDNITSSRNIGGGIGTNSVYRANNEIDLVSGFTVGKGSELYAHIGPCISGVPTLLKKEREENNEEVEDMEEEYIISLKTPSDENNLGSLEFVLNKARILTITLETTDDQLIETLYFNDYFPIGIHTLKIPENHDNDLRLIVKDAHGIVLFKK